MDYGKTRELFFVVHGKPKSKRTGKISTFGGHPRLIKNAETAMFENMVALSFKAAYPKETATDKHVKIEIDAFFAPPKHISRKKELIINTFAYPYCKKPDCSNITKAVEDGLNHIAYCDDSQIIECSCRKYYSYNERTEVKITIYEELEKI